MDADKAPQGNIFGSIFDFLKVLGASLTGITAILTAAGFLAERSRLAMLGLPSSTFDLEQYVETGALLLSLLPVLMGIAILLIILSWLQGAPAALLGAASVIGLGTFLLAAGGAGWLIYLWMKQPVRDGSSHRRRWLHAPARFLRRVSSRFGLAAVLVLALVIQITSLGREVQILEVRDVLFRPDAEAVAIEPGGTTSSVRELRSDRSRAVRVFGEMVLFTAMNALVLYYVVVKKLPADASGWKRLTLRTWSVVTLLLLVSQATLLPWSYGILLSRNTYPEVCAELTEASQSLPDALPATRLSLVHQSGEGYFLYSRAERRMWFVPRGSVESMVHYARVDVLSPAQHEPCPPTE